MRGGDLQRRRKIWAERHHHHEVEHVDELNRAHQKYDQPLRHDRGRRARDRRVAGFFGGNHRLHLVRAETAGKADRLNFLHTLLARCGARCNLRPCRRSCSSSLAGSRLSGTPSRHRRR